MEVTTAKGYKSLEVWQHARALVVRLYEITFELPETEKFGLTSQIRRAATSVPANIAEGYGRRTKADYARFLRIAKGSINEIEALLIICEDLGLLGVDSEIFEDIASVDSQLSNLISKVSPNIVKESAAIYADDFEFED